MSLSIFRVLSTPIHRLVLKNLRWIEPFHAAVVIDWFFDLCFHFLAELGIEMDPPRLARDRVLNPLLDCRMNSHSFRSEFANEVRFLALDFGLTAVVFYVMAKVLMQRI